MSSISVAWLGNILHVNRNSSGQTTRLSCTSSLGGCRGRRGEGEEREGGRGKEREGGGRGEGGERGEGGGRGKEREGGGREGREEVEGGRG